MQYLTNTQNKNLQPCKIIHNFVVVETVKLFIPVSISGFKAKFFGKGKLLSFICRETLYI